MSGGSKGGSHQYCSIATCKNSGRTARKEGKQIKFHGFPKNEEIRKLWALKCRNIATWDPADKADKRVCSIHFKPEDYEDELMARLLGYQPKKLKKEAVPSLCLEPLEGEESRKRERRIKCSKKTQKEKKAQDLLTPLRADRPVVVSKPLQCFTAAEETNEVVIKGEIIDIKEIIGQEEIIDIKEEIIDSKEQTSDLEEMSDSDEDVSDSEEELWDPDKEMSGSDEEITDSDKEKSDSEKEMYSHEVPITKPACVCAAAQPLLQLHENRSESAPATPSVGELLAENSLLKKKISILEKRNRKKSTKISTLLTQRSRLQKNIQRNYLLIPLATPWRLVRFPSGITLDFPSPPLETAKRRPMR